MYNERINSCITIRIDIWTGAWESKQLSQVLRLFFEEQTQHIIICNLTRVERLAWSRWKSDCTCSRTYFSQYFMVKSRNITTFTPEYRLKHVSTHARNRKNPYSTADYHLKWLSWKTKLMKLLWKQCVWEWRRTKPAASPRETMTITMKRSGANCTHAISCQCTARSRQLSTARRELARACFGVIAASLHAKPRDYT